MRNAAALVIAAGLVLSMCAPMRPAGADKASLDRSCTRDDDCVPAPGCCPVPCTENVINRNAAEQAAARLECDPSRECVSAGGCRTFAYLCASGSCALVYEGDDGYRPRD